MRKCIFFLLIVTGLTSCELSNPDSGIDPGTIVYDSLDTEAIMKIGENVIYDYSDIELYDSSTHILYFSDNHPELDKLRQSEFEVYVGTDVIFQGQFWPTYLSTLPQGIYIRNMPYFCQNFALRFDYRGTTLPDLRNDARIVENLKKKDLLHSGLTVQMSSLEISGTLGKLTLIITNRDKSDLLILDPDKMGHKLFHYFTNGLSLRNMSDDSKFQSIHEWQSPEPWNSWSMDWLSRINPGESKSFTLNYSFSSDVAPGTYQAWFEYPGLSFQVAIDQLFQTSGRIWLGDITPNTTITVK